MRNKNGSAVVTIARVEAQTDLDLSSTSRKDADMLLVEMARWRERGLPPKTNAGLAAVGTSRDNPTRAS
jgi:hypothetical protein